jgi:hypothetical protein
MTEQQTTPPTEGGNADGDGQQPEKTFTQADLDRIVSERVTRERAKYADYGDLRKKASEFDALAEKSKSDTERAIEAARQEAATQARTEVQRDRVIDKIEVAAAGKFTDLEDATLRLGRNADEFIGKDGAIDTAAISAAVDKLLKDKPHLAAVAKETPPPDFDGGTRRSADKPTDMNSLIRQKAGYGR